MYIRFSGNSAAFASELLENHEETFLLLHMHSDKLSLFKISITHYCATRREWNNLASRRMSQLLYHEASSAHTFLSELSLIPGVDKHYECRILLLRSRFIHHLVMFRG